MKLLVQPDDGIAALLSGIRSAKKSIEIVIFRFDRAEIEAGLKAAVGRGNITLAFAGSVIAIGRGMRHPREGGDSGA